ncbi:sensor histidine kinase [Wenjunlia tyrosinilytica]|uniref:histidine kinase n=1 Tax=Wenjunlia tyrosinilytica TaxID=1544741 RepID=A0A917ZPW3_9ACTN|nr:histidine kinase [Wenjunlia tyrosinilytica]GGO87581.1 hypothetical protein GCM10012280_26360 [Wenjunlia tyrosinilytica]
MTKLRGLHYTYVRNRLKATGWTADAARKDICADAALPRFRPGLMASLIERALPARLRDRTVAARTAAREEERRRLRRDLHDGLGATLAGVRLVLDSAAARLAHEPTARRLVLHAAAETARTVEEIRRIIDDLRPPDLEDAGLPVALRRLAARLDSPAVAVTAEVPDHPLDLSCTTELAAYRIASEGLANVLRHSGASTVTVRLEVEGGTLVLDVLDDGIGPSPGCRRGRGTGLASMARRAHEAGGHFALLPRPDARPGTLVRAVLPRGRA